MPFEVMTNWDKWHRGDVISAGDIQEVTGMIPGTDARPPQKSEIQKLGLTETKGVSDDRIDELCSRGILHPIGEDVRVLKLGTPKFEDRAAAIKAYNASDLV